MTVPGNVSPALARAGALASFVVSPSASTAAENCAIAIIGAGFSGTMVAIHLRRLLPPEQKIYLIERSGDFARGLAYADTGAAHLLNVRVANMSAFPGDPGHFERWVEQHAAAWPGEIHATPAGCFATRRLYGAYLQATLQEEIASSGGTVRLLADDVQELTRTAEGWRLNGQSGRQVLAQGVVLATGGLPAERPCDGVEFRDPWAPAALAGLDPALPVLIIGTGLTMVDLVLALQAQGFAGRIIALSRRGLVPHPHEAIERSWPAAAFSPAECGTARGLLRAVRAQARAAAAQGVGWRAVIDSLRPITATLWEGLPAPERARFLRHLRPYWDIHRHRIAPPAAAIFGWLRASGALTILRARVREVRREAGRAIVSIDAATGGSQNITAQRVIYATGLQGLRPGEGLVAALLAGGQARLDRLELGLDVTPSLNVIDGQGRAETHLWALGPIVRGVFWECLAVPDIRQQAGRLGGEIAAALVGAAGG